MRALSKTYWAPGDDKGADQSTVWQQANFEALKKLAFCQLRRNLALFDPQTGPKQGQKIKILKI